MLLSHCEKHCGARLNQVGGFLLDSPNFPCLDWLGCLGRWTGERIQQEREGNRGSQHKFNLRMNIQAKCEGFGLDRPCMAEPRV